MIRLYYNTRNAADGLVWSIDAGDVDTERNYRRVYIMCEMSTEFDPDVQLPRPSGYLCTFRPNTFVHEFESPEGVPCAFIMEDAGIINSRQPKNNE